MAEQTSTSCRAHATREMAEAEASILPSVKALHIGAAGKWSAMADRLLASEQNRQRNIARVLHLPAPTA